MLVAGEAAVAAVLVVGSALLIRTSLAPGVPLCIRPASISAFSYQLSAISSLGGRPQLFPRE
jgi:hypothetical protein